MAHERFTFQIDEVMMKRSAINTIMRSANTFIHARGFFLPPFAYWSAADWQTTGPEIQELVEHRLGWDVTDFGSGDFARRGLFLFTLRNGHPAKPQSKPYAEKLLIVRQEQVTPLHFHWKKTEESFAEIGVWDPWTHREGFFSAWWMGSVGVASGQVPDSRPR